MFSRYVFLQEELYVAAQQGDVDTVKRLLDQGTKSDTQSYWGHRALHLAALNGHVDIVQLLLAKGAAIDAQTTAWASGETPLHCAVRSCSVETVKLLLDRGAPINAQNKAGQTPLYCAVWHFTSSEEDYEKIIRLLLAAGADVHLTNQEGETALYCLVDIEESESQTRLLELIPCFWEHGALLFEPLQITADDGQTQSISVHARLSDDLKPEMQQQYAQFITQTLKDNKAFNQIVDKEKEAMTTPQAYPDQVRATVVGRFLAAKQAVYRLAPDFILWFKLYQKIAGFQAGWNKLPPELKDKILVYFLIDKGIEAQFASLALFLDFVWETVFPEFKDSEVPLEAALAARSSTPSRV